MSIHSTMTETIEHDGSKHSEGDPLPPKCAVIEVHLAELKQLFNSIDPSPFRNRDLDPKAEEFIVGWAKDMPRDAPLALLVDLDRPAGLPDEAVVLRDAIHEFFHPRAQALWPRLRDLFRVGRTAARTGRAGAILWHLRIPMGALGQPYRLGCTRCGLPARREGSVATKCIQQVRKRHHVPQSAMYSRTVSKKDWPRFVQEEPEVYEREELEKLFKCCGEEERLWFEFVKAAYKSCMRNLGF